MELLAQEKSHRLFCNQNLLYKLTVSKQPPCSFLPFSVFLLSFFSSYQVALMDLEDSIKVGLDRREPNQKFLNPT